MFTGSPFFEVRTTHNVEPNPYDHDRKDH